MRDALRSLIRQPVSGKELELVVFEASSNGVSSDVREGILFSSPSGPAYPIVDGVPVMIEDQFLKRFLDRHRAAISNHPKLCTLSLKPSSNKDWSFSREWEEHFQKGSERTWGYTARERLEQFLMETQTSNDSLRGKLVLDAGCGNGLLSHEISSLGAVVVGLDYSSSVANAERCRQSDDLHFIQGDLQAPPLKDSSFDLAISIGVLHHTPMTLNTFSTVARLIKPGGKFYVWLYRRPERFLGRYVKIPIYDLMRMTISRLPSQLQEKAVGAYARLARASHAFRDSSNPVPLWEYVVSAYDDLTPRWRHYHTPLEVSRWFHGCGFAAPTLTHWDNPYGFGLLATKDPQSATPGIHYGTRAKLWDEKRTLLGRLHAD